jgi:L-fuconolactonase
MLLARRKNHVRRRHISRDFEVTSRVVDPDRLIIDAHHHLWEVPGRYYMADECLHDLQAGHRIVATVHIEALSRYRVSGPEPLRSVGETEMAVEAAQWVETQTSAQIRMCAGIVAYVDMTLGDWVQDSIDAHRDAGGDRFCGIRDAATWDPDDRIVNGYWRRGPQRYAELSFRAGFRALARNGLSFDAWLYHTQLDDVYGLASEFPDTAIVLDHAGGPLGIGTYADHKEAAYAAWVSSLRRVSQLPNVFLKIGGLGMPFGPLGLAGRPERPSSAEIARIMRPYVEPSVDCFGPARCMFESNFPVDRISYDYVEVWNAFKHLAAAYSEEEQHSLFFGTANRVYGLGL